MMDEIRQILDYLTSAAGIRDIFGYFVLISVMAGFVRLMRIGIGTTITKQKHKHEHQHKS